MRFTIRDVLWLMVVVGIGAGWYVHGARRAENRRRELEAIATYMREHYGVKIIVDNRKVVIAEPLHDVRHQIKP